MSWSEVAETVALGAIAGYILVKFLFWLWSDDEERKD